MNFTENLISTINIVVKSDVNIDKKNQLRKTSVDILFSQNNCYKY